MEDLKELTAENGIDETLENVESLLDAPESMQIEFADGKGGED